MRSSRGDDGLAAPRLSRVGESLPGGELSGAHDELMALAAALHEENLKRKRQYLRRCLETVAPPVVRRLKAIRGRPPAPLNPARLRRPFLQLHDPLCGEQPTC